jgi:hypothetical protein
MPPPTKKKKKKEKEKKETLSPTPKERKQERRMHWHLEEELVKLFVCRCYLRKKISFIPPYKFGFVRDRKWLPKNRKAKRKKKKNPLTHLT